MKKWIAVALALAATAACRKHEYTDAKGNKVEFTEGANSVKVTTPEGTAEYTAGGGATIPADFPKDVPIYTGAKVTGSVHGQGAASGGYVISMETADSPDQVIAFYKGKLSGWKSQMEATTAAGHTFIVASPDGKRSVSVVATPEGSKTSIALTVGEKS